MSNYYMDIDRYLNQIDDGVWLEIGVDTGSVSTQFFCAKAASRGARFIGVDACKENINRITGILSTDNKLPFHVELVCAKGEDYLDNLDDEDSDIEFSLVYLDNFDWNFWLQKEEAHYIPSRKQQYRDKWNVEMTNINSQLTHLMQVISLEERLTEQSIVICADTWYEPAEGIYLGKCSAVVPYLALYGFKVVSAQGYRNNSDSSCVIMHRSNN